MEFSVQIDQDDLARASNPVHNFHLCPRGCGLNLPVDIITFFFFFLSTYHMLSVVLGTLPMLCHLRFSTTCEMNGIVTILQRTKLMFWDVVTSPRIPR